jgi:glucosyl-3-phosphoglycerate synthase
MPDFFQHARVPTLHHLTSSSIAEREAHLCEWTQEKPVALLLPALQAEFERPALPRILDEIALAPYISEIVLSVNGMSEKQHREAIAMCRGRLGEKPFHLLWNDGPRGNALSKALANTGCSTLPAGKGANVWLGLAHLLARDFDGVVITHDTDIMSYGRDLLWKLCFPLVHPRMPYRFAKGYYSRVSDRLYGRVTRLLIFPLIQAFIEVLGAKPLLSHLESFRYPLAGEFGGEARFLGQLPLPHGWGLEITMLCEAHQRLSPREMCQVDLGFHFEHRHRSLEEGVHEHDSGLAHAAEEVARCLFQQVLRHAEERAATSLFTLVRERYHARAAEWMERYEHVALLNGLQFDRENEESTVALFEAALENITVQTSEQDSLACLPPVAPLLLEHPAVKSLLSQAD